MKILTDLSSEADSIKRESGLKDTDFTHAPCDLIAVEGYPSTALLFHTLIVLSIDAEAMRFPLGEKATYFEHFLTSVIAAVCPGSFLAWMFLA